MSNSTLTWAERAKKSLPSNGNSSFPNALPSAVSVSATFIPGNTSDKPAMNGANGAAMDEREGKRKGKKKRKAGIDSQFTAYSSSVIPNPLSPENESTLPLSPSNFEESSPSIPSVISSLNTKSSSTPQSSSQHTPTTTSSTLPSTSGNSTSFPTTSGNVWELRKERARLKKEAEERERIAQEEKERLTASVADNRKEIEQDVREAAKVLVEKPEVTNGSTTGGYEEFTTPKVDTIETEDEPTLVIGQKENGEATSVEESPFIDAPVQTSSPNTSSEKKKPGIWNTLIIPDATHTTVSSSNAAPKEFPPLSSASTSSPPSPPIFKKEKDDSASNSASEVAVTAGSSPTAVKDGKKKKWIPIKAEITINAPLPTKRNRNRAVAENTGDDHTFSTTKEKERDYKEKRKEKRDVNASLLGLPPVSVTSTAAAVTYLAKADPVSTLNGSAVVGSVQSMIISSSAPFTSPQLASTSTRHISHSPPSLVSSSTASTSQNKINDKTTHPNPISTLEESVEQTPFSNGPPNKPALFPNPTVSAPTEQKTEKESSSSSIGHSFEGANAISSSPSPNAIKGAKLIGSPVGSNKSLTRDFSGNGIAVNGTGIPYGSRWTGDRFRGRGRGRGRGSWVGRGGAGGWREGPRGHFFTYGQNPHYPSPTFYQQPEYFFPVVVPFVSPSGDQQTYAPYPFPQYYVFSPPVIAAPMQSPAMIPQPGLGANHGSSFERPPPVTHPYPADPLKYYVLGQAEWYFSVDNLCKDMFLRGQMDSQGWVDIPMVASFNRIKSLTEDMTLVRDTISLSTFLEVRDWKVRKRGDWYHWILDKAAPSTLSQTTNPKQHSEGPPMTSVIGGVNGESGTSNYSEEGEDTWTGTTAATSPGGSAQETVIDREADMPKVGPATQKTIAIGFDPSVQSHHVPRRRKSSSKQI